MTKELKPPKGSPAKVEYHMKQLRKLFSRSTDEKFLQMIWAIDALRSGRPDVAAQLLTFPAAARDQGMDSRYRIHQWELETLLVQLFLAPSEEPKLDAANFDCRKFDAIADLVNRLRKLEDIESAVYLRGSDFNVFDELHRIAQRQFHWQRGYWNLPQLYRYAYLYAQGKCGEYFKHTYGIPITELNFVGVALFLQSTQAAWTKRSIALPELELTEDLVERALPLLLISANQAREETRKIVDQVNKKHGRPIPTAFLPSILRRYPLVCLEENSDLFVAPIPEVLLMRVTAGLYYDLIPGGQSLLNEASDRFEQYSADYIDALMDRFDVRRSYRYEPKKGAPIDTPDILVKDGGKLVLAIECKATKLTYLAQFAEDPFETDRKQYLQIANGVLQLWRFFSHARRRLIAETVDVDTAAIVLTLDTFMTMNRELKAKIIAEANAMADKEEDISVQDRRHIIFCPIVGLEEILSVSTEDDFLASLRAARAEKYVGWEFREINRDELKHKERIEQKKFPFELDGLLPWWDRVKDIREKKEGAGSKS